MNFTRQTIPTVSAVPEEPKQETAKQATVNIRVDANCTMLCDGEYIETQFQANKITKMNLPIGQHLLEFFDMDYPEIIIEQEVDWPEEGKAYLVMIKGLQEKIEAARQTEEDKKRDAAAQKAIAEAERKAKEEAARRAIAEMERKAAEETERKVREEEERKAMAEAGSSQVINGHEYVDLGLSVCWATCNIGASAPEDNGDYFAWGEITPGKNIEPKTLTNKYKTGAGEYYVPVGDITGGKFDAASVNWGRNWRMPTMSEWDELWKKCVKRKIVVNGITCLEIEGPNKAVIRLPYAGFFSLGKSYDVGKLGVYWTGTGPKVPQKLDFLGGTLSNVRIKKSWEDNSPAYNSINVPQKETSFFEACSIRPVINK